MASTLGASIWKSLLTTSIGAFSASLSILLTLSFGVFASQTNLLSESSAEDISHLCSKLFLPALLIVNVGEHIEAARWREYLPIFIWGLTYTFLSCLLGMGLTKLFKLPRWAAPAVAFNNTTSLPLLLTKALGSTGILRSILAPGQGMEASIERAKSYFLVNSMVSNSLTFSLGPKLIGSSDYTDDSDSDSDDEESGDPDENTSLLPERVNEAAYQTKTALQNALSSANAALPVPLQKMNNTLFTLINPTLLGSFLALFIGLIPPISHAFFAETFDGGFLSAWLTASLRNVGELFTVMQMFVSGSDLSASLKTKQKSVRLNKKAFAIVFIIRFILWPLIAIGLVYVFATKTDFLPKTLATSAEGAVRDEFGMLLFSLMLMPGGPPAISLSTMVMVSTSGKEGRKEGLRVARMLAGMYVLSPLVAVSVVGALKASERAVAVREGRI
ncbi:hypothetical protein BJ508DRAFT_414665 [Ascobolus immersus RN42]|uniref:Auxin efflux carrier n=1 Tax=Ascobolus immersus RN42 TaxID=1160509 RepID=A0A3N4I675_ASCIM|nr:hypothetical protein BJ508DRAFT_414665 [Ascobolus immersus RN42]